VIKINFQKFLMSIKYTHYFLIGIEIIVALVSGLIFIAIGAGGGAWILGGIASGALVFYFYRSIYNNQAEPNRNSRKVGQIIVGLTVGFSIKHNDILALYSQLHIFLLLTFFLLFSGVIIGYIYSRLEKTDLLTGMLATVPGNIGIMASIAADYGRNISLVSIVQLIRFTSIIIVIPIIASVSNSHDISKIIDSVTTSLFSFGLTNFSLLSLLLFITVLTVKLGSQFKIPVAGFFCSIIVGTIFNSSLDSLPFLAHIDFNLPPLFNLIGQVLLGITIGEYWGMKPKLGKLTIAYTLVPVAMTFVAGLVSAGIAMFLTPWDWLTCLLVTSPGGSPEMIFISLALHHNVEIVTAGHLVRLMAINLSLPALVSFVYYLERSSTEKQHRDRVVEKTAT
jgi:hypothetical protein